MPAIKQIFQETNEQLLKLYEADEAKKMTQILFEDLFDIDSYNLSSELKEDETSLVGKSIARLMDYEPIQYVTGKAHFFGNVFSIKSGALIPRQETEELVNWILEENDLLSPAIADVGTGSGCIAISLALQLDVEVMATDVSEDAIAIALSNADMLGAKVQLIHNDILKEEFPFNDLDVLVSNPPYIPVIDKADMHRNVLDYEPEQALFVPNESPLVFYDAIAEVGLKSLKDGGRLYFEIHERFGIEVQSMLRSKGYESVVVKQDLNGKDRMVRAINSANT